jgi:hypothetical protein
MPERNCATCTKKQQRDWGCDAAKNENGEWVGHKAVIPDTFDDEDYFGCLRRPVKDDPGFFSELMSLYGLYKEGVLADEGSISSQATRYVTLMRLVHGVVNECHAKQREDAQKGR